LQWPLDHAVDHELVVIELALREGAIRIAVRFSRAVAAEGCDAIVILCTNMDGAAITAALERELKVLILDSVAVTLWRTMLLADADPRILSAWGRVFQYTHP